MEPILTADQKAHVDRVTRDAVAAERKRLCAVCAECDAAGVDSAPYIDGGHTPDQVAAEPAVIAGKKYRQEYRDNPELQKRMSERDYVESRRVDDGFSRLQFSQIPDSSAPPASEPAAEPAAELPRPPHLGKPGTAYGLGTCPVSGQPL